MMKSKTRSKSNKNKAPWRPRGDKLIPGHKVETPKKGPGAYSRKRGKKYNAWDIF
jgi:hypothetical protein